MGKLIVDFSKSHYGTAAGVIVGAILMMLAERYSWLKPLIGTTTAP